MDAYAYRAALYCEECGEAILATIKTPDTGDSDDYPQGPYAYGGGEADRPQHCDRCGVFLENVLTSDGDTYLRGRVEPYLVEGDSWEQAACRAEGLGHPMEAEWIRHYLAPGQ